MHVILFILCMIQHVLGTYQNTSCTISLKNASYAETIIVSVRQARLKRSLCRCRSVYKDLATLATLGPRMKDCPTLSLNPIENLTVFQSTICKQRNILRLIYKQ